jgi:hypothetical protein
MVSRVILSEAKNLSWTLEVKLAAQSEMFRFAQHDKVAGFEFGEYAWKRV